MSGKLKSLESNAKAASVDFPIWEHFWPVARLKRPLEAKCQPVGTRPPLRQNGQSLHLRHSAKTFALSQLRFPSAALARSGMPLATLQGKVGSLCEDSACRR